MRRTTGADYGEVPGWYRELRNLEYTADRLRCSLLDLVDGTGGRPQIVHLVLLARQVEIDADNEIRKYTTTSGA